jgi:hypothetical protein
MAFVFARQETACRRTERIASKETEENQPPLDGSYARSLALAGTVHADFTDVSVDKYKHLAEAYADRNDNQ